MNGSLTANGQNGLGNYAGGGSGGGIYVKCRVFAGSGGVLSAQGGNYGSYTSGGGGGGGRIAVWRVTDRYTGAVATNVSGGVGVNNGVVGTVYWGVLPTSGTVITLR